MNDTDKTPAQGSAAASLGAHSKDAHEKPGAERQQGSDNSSMADTVQDYAGRAREGLEHVGEKAREMAGTARDAVANQGARAAGQAQQMMRDQPMMALAVTGLAAFTLGVLLGGRR
jgi:ElaB/YqjD/DUF883 family membrane-anchored ribosome-binding protein